MIIFISSHALCFIQYQFSFRHHHSTSLALIEFTDSLHIHTDKHNIVIGMHFDLQKTFDTDDHEILCASCIITVCGTVRK